MNNNNLANCYRPHFQNALISNLMQTMDRIVETNNACEDINSRAYAYIGVVVYSILMRNETITNYAVEAIGIIKSDKQLYRQEIKKAVNDADKAVKSYNHMVGFVIYDDNEMFDALDDISEKYAEKISNPVQTFYYSIKQEMDSNKVENSALRANIEFVSSLLQIALDEQDRIEKTNFLLRKRIRHMRYLRLDRLKEAWDRVSYLINGRYPKDVNLNTERCNLACENLYRAMNDYRMIAKIFSGSDEGE